MSASAPRIMAFTSGDVYSRSLSTVSFRRRPTWLARFRQVTPYTGCPSTWYSMRWERYSVPAGSVPTRTTWGTAPWDHWYSGTPAFSEPGIFPRGWAVLAKRMRPRPSRKRLVSGADTQP